MLGNDVVDLRDPESRPESFRPRFDERVFSPDERWAIAHDRDPLARRWAHWAAKEAAYKLARQIDSTFVFSPRRLIASYAPVESRVGQRLERRGQVVVGGAGDGSEVPVRRVSLRSFETSDRIHVVAVPETTDWGAVDFAVERLDPGQQDSSAAVRKMAIAEIGRHLGVSLDRLSIGRRGRIPTVLLDGSVTSLSLSLSHHGNWIGYSMALRMDSSIHVDQADDWHRAASPMPPMSPTSPTSTLAKRVQTA